MFNAWNLAVCSSVTLIHVSADKHWRINILLSSFKNFSIYFNTHFLFCKIRLNLHWFAKAWGSKCFLNWNSLMYFNNYCLLSLPPPSSCLSSEVYSWTLSLVTQISHGSNALWTSPNLSFLTKSFLEFLKMPTFV